MTKYAALSNSAVKPLSQQELVDQERLNVTTNYHFQHWLS